MSNHANPRRPESHVRHESRWGRRSGEVQRRPRPVAAKSGKGGVQRETLRPCPRCGIRERMVIDSRGIRFYGQHSLACRLAGARQASKTFGLPMEAWL